MSQIYLGDKIIASTLGSDIKYDENTSVNDKIDEHATLIDEQNKNFAWKLIDTKGYDSIINVPSDANEVFVKAFASSGETATAQFPKMAMSNGIWYLTGGVTNAIADGSCYATINVTQSTVGLRLFYVDGTKVNSCQISVYYR